MKKNINESLNTTISNSPQPAIHKSPLNFSQTLLKGKPLKPQSSALDIRCDDSKQISSSQILTLQIEQLKRENKLLKKKVDELSLGLENDRSKTKILIQKENQETPKKIQNLPLTVNFFFEEISQLLESIVKIFKIDLLGQDITKLKTLSQRDNEFSFTKKYSILKSGEIKRSIDKIMREEESSRFQKFIDLFAQYYKAKEEREKKLIEKIDAMTLKANQLNKSLLTKCQQPKRVKQTFSPQPLVLDKEFKEFLKPSITSRHHQRNKSNMESSNQTTVRFFRRTNRPPEQQ